MDKEKSPLGIVSFVGTFGLLAVAAWQAGTFGPVWREVILLLTGNVSEITRMPGDYLHMVQTVPAVLVFDIVLCLAATVIAKLCGPCQDHALTKYLYPPEEVPLFRFFFIAVVGEELFARWLFLGVLTKISFLSGTAGFYLLFLLGNAIWSAIHLGNFKPEDRHILRVLPQLIGGIFLTYVYQKYGLTAAILTHFAFNAVLFSLAKRQRVNHVDGLTFAYSVMLALAAFFLLQRSPLEAVAWLEAKEGFVLPNWNVRDYFLFVIFFTMTATALAELLLYDKSNLRKVKSSDKSHSAIQMVGTLPIVAAVLVAAARGLNWALRLFIRRAVTRIGALSVLFALVTEAKSANAVGRTFWIGVPSGFVILAIMQALGFWQATLLVLGTFVVELPLYTLKRFDD